LDQPRGEGFTGPPSSGFRGSVNLRGKSEGNTHPEVSEIPRIRNSEAARDPEDRIKLRKGSQEPSNTPRCCSWGWV
jgi:hypothetical protein